MAEIVQLSERKPPPPRPLSPPLFHRRVAEFIRMMNLPQLIGNARTWIFQELMWAIWFYGDGEELRFGRAFKTCDELLNALNATGEDLDALIARELVNRTRHGLSLPHRAGLRPEDRYR